MRTALAVAILAALASFQETPATAPTDPPHLSLLRQQPAPVITTRTPDARDIRFGFEGGRAVKVRDRYHLFTSEMVDNPMWVRMRFGHWTSADRMHWSRVSTIRESSGEFEGHDPRAALWSPLPVWDEREGRWNLFYVAYHSRPGDGTQFLLNHHGRIWRAVSRTAGIDGIGGPYDDVGVILQPGTDSLPWEGLQGTDSFFPYRVGASWYAFYGSARTERMPIEHWLVGLASAPSLAGPWVRLREHSPAPIEKRFIENPIVTPAPGGGWLAVYDNEAQDAVGWSYSADGVRWQPGRSLTVQPSPRQWAHDVRTALGLIDEGDGRYTLFYTGFEQPPDWPRLLKGEGRETCAIGFVELRIGR